MGLCPLNQRKEECQRSKCQWWQYDASDSPQQRDVNGNCAICFIEQSLDDIAQSLHED